MSLWTPKDASRPLWTPGRKPPSYTGRRLLPPSFAMEYLKDPKGGSGGTINVSDKTLEEAYLLLVAATGERGWGRIPEELTKAPGLCSGRILREE